MPAVSKSILEIESRNRWTYVFWASVMVPMVFGPLGIVFLWQSSRETNLIETLRQRGSVATGKIHEVRYKDPGFFCARSCHSFFPLYEYKTVSGEVRKCWGSGTGRDEMFQVGESVEILFDGEKCYDQQFQIRAGQSHILGITMLAAAALGLAGIFVSSRKRIPKTS